MYVFLRLLPSPLLLFWHVFVDLRRPLAGAIRDSLFHFLCSSDSMSALDMANPIADELILLEGSGLEVYDALHNKMVVPAALPPPPAATLPPPPAALPPPAAAPRGPALIQPECGGLV